LAEPLQITLLDASNQPISGAAVAFTVAASSAITDAEIVEDPRYGATTDGFGVASVLVKPGRGTTGKLDVEARVAGLPAVVVPFTATVMKGVIKPDPNNVTPLQSGGANLLNFYF